MIFKVCTKCGLEKSLSNFYKNKKGKYNRHSFCKICFKIYLKNKRQKYPWKRALESAKQRCNNPKNNRYYCYGAIGIKCFLKENEIKKLWFKYNADRMKKPTLDRKNVKKNYTYNNCQFIEHDINTGKDRKRTILQYDLNCDFIKEWESAKIAGITLNINCGNITQCCKGNKGYTHVNNFIWRYKQC